jgi:hypothetical protein
LLIVRWVLDAPDSNGVRMSGMSLILENGDVHRFYAVGGDIQHTHTTEFRGRYEHAISREMSRPGAQIVYQWGVVG